MIYSQEGNAIGFFSACRTEWMDCQGDPGNNAEWHAISIASFLTGKQCWRKGFQSFSPCKFLKLHCLLKQLFVLWGKHTDRCIFFLCMTPQKLSRWFRARQQHEKYPLLLVPFLRPGPPLYKHTQREGVGTYFEWKKVTADPTIDLPLLHLVPPYVSQNMRHLQPAFLTKCMFWSNGMCWDPRTWQSKHLKSTQCIFWEIGSAILACLQRWCHVVASTRGAKCWRASAEQQPCVGAPPLTPTSLPQPHAECVTECRM